MGYATYEDIATHLPAHYRIAEDISNVDPGAIAGWYVRIDLQLDKMARDYEAAGNLDYVRKISAFRSTWNENPLTRDNSVDRATFEKLIAVSKQLASDGWKLSDYFGGIYKSLEIALTKIIQLGRATMAASPGPKSPDKGAGSFRIAPPASKFGPEKTPEDELNPLGAPEAAGETNPASPEAEAGEEEASKLPPPP